VLKEGHIKGLQNFDKSKIILRELKNLILFFFNKLFCTKKPTAPGGFTPNKMKKLLTNRQTKALVRVPDSGESGSQ
jgi:hypothetical protein